MTHNMEDVLARGFLRRALLPAQVFDHAPPSGGNEALNDATHTVSASFVAGYAFKTGDMYFRDMAKAHAVLLSVLANATKHLEPDGKAPLAGGGNNARRPLELRDATLLYNVTPTLEAIPSAPNEVTGVRVCAGYRFTWNMHEITSAYGARAVADVPQDGGGDDDDGGDGMTVAQREKATRKAKLDRITALARESPLALGTTAPCPPLPFHPRFCRHCTVLCRSP